MAIDDASPNLYGLEAGILAALYLQDTVRLEAVRDRLAETPFRGRRIDCFDLAVEAGLETREGDTVRAGAMFLEAVDQLRSVEFPPVSGMIAAFAARLLGTKSEAGHELAVAAYEICSAYNLSSISQLVPEALLEPESNHPAAAAIA